MVGYGRTESGVGGAGNIGSLRYLANNDGIYPEYDYITLLENQADPANSAWASRDDVFYWGVNGASAQLSDDPANDAAHGKLKPAYGARSNWFGPEYGFGQVVGNFYDGASEQPVLLIKTSWGGHSLYGNFRPPSAVSKRGGTVGASFQQMMGNVRIALDGLETFFPAGDYPEFNAVGYRYEIVGFAWHQGTSDKTPYPAYEYRDNLPDLISDVRGAFGKPDLPFVIATTGMSDVGPSEPYPYEGYHAVEKAQLWVAGVEQPDNVLTDDTRDYWEDQADSPSSQTYHWGHHARSYFRVGLGLGEKMTNLLEP